MRFAMRFSFFLLPALIQGGLSFLMLPATTYVLDPADFGAFALLSSLVAFAGALASLGSAYLLSAHFPSLDRAGRKGLVSAIFLMGTATSLLFVAGFLGLWPYIAGWEGMKTIPASAVYLSLAGALLIYPWTLACDISVLEGKSKVYAATTISQAVVGAISTLAGLFHFKLGLLSLFVSGVMAGLVCFISGMIVLRPYLGVSGIRAWLGPILRIGPLAALGNLAESLQSASERTILSNHAGLASLGVYSHSQQYRQLVFTGVKAATRSIWPTTLKESREALPAYLKTAKVWALVHVGLTMAGVFFATIGKEFISALTNNKFTNAYPFVAVWMVVLLVKHSGRAELGYMTAHNHTAYLANLSLATLCGSIACMFFLIPRLGMSGAVISMFLQDLGYRVGLTLKARSLQDFDFHDGWAIRGAILILAALAVTFFLRPHSALSLGLMFSMEAFLIWIAYGKLRSISVPAAAIPVPLPGNPG